MVCLVDAAAATKGVGAHAARTGPGGRAGATSPPPLCAGWHRESGLLRDLGSLRWRFKEDGREQPELR